MIERKNGLILYKDEKGKVYNVSISKFSEEIREELSKYELKKITIDSTDCISDFSFIVSQKKISELIIRFDYKTIDITFVNSLKKLEYLGAPKFIGKIENENIVNLGYRWYKMSDISECKKLEILTVHNCSDMELFISQIIKLKKLHELKFFRISSSTFPKSDEGTTVKELEFTYCPKLENIEELASNFPDVTKLKFDHCRNIQDYSPLNKLEKLQELYIFESAPITDLSFLENMKNLKLIKILKTKITAKNISFLDLIPKADLLMTGIGKC